jgi:hypothetical protein
MSPDKYEWGLSGSCDADSNECATWHSHIVVARHEEGEWSRREAARCVYATAFSACQTICNHGESFEAAHGEKSFSRCTISEHSTRVSMTTCATWREGGGGSSWTSRGEGKGGTCQVQAAGACTTSVHRRTLCTYYELVSMHHTHNPTTRPKQGTAHSQVGVLNGYVGRHDPRRPNDVACTLSDGSAEHRCQAQHQQQHGCTLDRCSDRCVTPVSCESTVLHDDLTALGPVRLQPF